MAKNRTALLCRCFIISYFIFLSTVVVLAGEGGGESARLLDLVQQKTLNYIWQGGDAETGMAYEASFAFPAEGRPLAVGATGFGVAAIVAGVERGWIDREAALERLEKMVAFLRDGTPRQKLHGAFPHWLHRQTGEVIAFSDLDDGADLVETAFLLQGLLIAEQYFDKDGRETELRAAIGQIWREVEWSWFADAENGGLYWHWNPKHNFSLGMKIQGFNECLVAYILALASPTYPITRDIFDFWYAGSGYDRRTLYGYDLEASLPGGGPLFLSHYSFIGLNPWEMADARVPSGYYVRNVKQVLSNRNYCLFAAPDSHRYDAAHWGLTASLTPDGYAANDPLHDEGVIAPTGALASLPYTPHYAMMALQSLIAENRCGVYGPYDAYSFRDDWQSSDYLALDQLPIAAMLENYRSGLLWRLFMARDDIRTGLQKSGIASPCLPAGFPEAIETTVLQQGQYRPDGYSACRHPDTGLYHIPYWVDKEECVTLALSSLDGKNLYVRRQTARPGRNWFDFPEVAPVNGSLYCLRLTTSSSAHVLRLRLY